MILHPLISFFIALCILALLCGKYSINKVRGRNLFLFISMIGMLIFRTFLDINSVPDLALYSSGFSQLTQMPLRQSLTDELVGVKIPEIGFRLLMKLVSIISENFTIFLLVLGVVWGIGYLSVILKYSQYVIISILFLFLDIYLQSIFVLRQHIAMLIAFISYKYIIEKKPIKYLMMMMIAFSFHQTAVIAMPIYFLYHIKNRKTLTFSFFVIAIVMVLYFSFIMNYFGRNALIGLSSYLEREEGSNATGSIIMAIHLLCYIVFLRKDIFKLGINRVLFISLVYGFIVITVGIGYNPTSRLCMYMTNISFLLIPTVMAYIKTGWLKYSYMLVMLGGYVYMASQSLSLGLSF